MPSIKQQLDKIEGLLGTRDISDWEGNFIANVVEKVKQSKGNTSVLSDRQVETIEQIHNKHFA